MELSSLIPINFSSLPYWPLMLVPTHVEPLWAVWWWRIVTQCKSIVRFVFLIYIYSDQISLPSVPAPSAVTVTAPPGVIAGASVTLTCAVELSPAVDVPVTVNTEWTGPADVIFMSANPVAALMVNITTYISTVSVGATRTGSYICQANIASGGTTSGSTDITVGMYLIASLYLNT